MQNSTNKITFWLIVSVGVIPMLLAIIMFYTQGFNPKQTINKGELVEQQNIEQWQLTYNQLQWQQSAQWQILHTLPSDCQSNQCQKWRENLPSVIKLLGKDSDRVVLFQVGESDAMLRTPKITQLGEAVWVVDPLGNVVLRYSPELAPKHLLKDLKKLLKVSGIG